MTLVSAPADYGKSTLVVEWLAQLERPSAWLSLDEADNNISRFLSYFIAALRTQFPEACADSWQLLRSADLPDSDTLVATLINDLMAYPQSLVLVLDDYHVIKGGNVQQVMNALVMRLPQNLHLLIVSRTDPLLPLPRLRTAGQLFEVRADTLRFSDDEAHQFLQMSGLTQADRLAAAELNQRIEGWAVGLQMAALSMGLQAEQKSLVVSSTIQGNEFVSDYLFSEVLQQQDPTVQEFLLYTSLLDRFNENLCLAVLDSENQTAFTRHEVRHILGDLIMANLFIIPLDEENGWHRYHHLFQQMLQQRLFEQLNDRQIAAIHQRASGWYAGHGYAEEALVHSLAAGDMETAVAIVEDNSRDILNGLQRRTLERWMASLPEDLIWQRPKLLLAKAWLLYRHWRLGTLESVLDRIVECLDIEQVHLDPAEQQFIRGQAYALRTATDFYLNLDFSSAIADAERAIEMLPDSELGSRFTAVLYHSLAQVGLDKKENGVRRIKAILHDPAPIGPAALQAMAGMNLVHYLSGDYGQMDYYVRQFLVQAEESPRLMGAASWMAGLLRYEQNKLEESAGHYAAMKQLRPLSNYVSGFYGWYALIRIDQIRGRYSEAQNSLDSLRADTLRIGNRAFLEAVEAMQAYQWLLEGDLANAYKWANSFQVEANGVQLFAFDTPELMWARILIAGGTRSDKKEVQAYLEKSLADIEATGFSRRRIQLRAHLASVAYGLDARASALRHLRAALILAFPTGTIRSFVDVGPSLIPLLVKLQKYGVVLVYISELLAAYEAESVSWEWAAGAKTIPEPDLLTRREEEILELMQASYTNQEIADQLVIALSTVKRHASNIYLKLDVKNRQQAVQKAEILGLLSI